MLTEEDLDAAIGAITRVLAAGGVFLASVRDYDALLVERPPGLPAMVRERAGRREIVGQAWEWSDDAVGLRIHLFVLREGADGWHTDVHTTWYRPLTRTGLNERAPRVRASKTCIGTCRTRAVTTSRWSPLACPLTSAERYPEPISRTVAIVSASAGDLSGR